MTSPPQDKLQLQTLFSKVFDTPEGRYVLEYLHQVYAVPLGTHVSNPQLLAYTAGQYDLLRGIQDILDGNINQMGDMYE